MLSTLAVAHYRSLHALVAPMGRLNLVTGANGSGKSNLYKALRLLADTARGGVVPALAREGGLASTLWAGPERPGARGHGSGVVQGGPRLAPVSLKLGFAGEDFGYAIDLGLPVPSQSVFGRDPEIKREVIWSGPFLRPASLLVDRRGATVRIRQGRGFEMMDAHLDPFESLFAQIADPRRAPEVLQLREAIRRWRFYDHFRSDAQAPARLPQLGTRTTALAHDGHDLGAAWATIREIGDPQALDAAVSDAFPGARAQVLQVDDGRFTLQFHQPGLLRPLSAAELSDGTLRYLLWIAALHTPRPPPLMVLNEPETSLHPDLLPALARLIAQAATRTQVWVVSHATRLIAALESVPDCHTLQLGKREGRTVVAGQGLLDAPAWHWPDR
ncbi:ATP-binding protein [Lysobacteraceae bacterium NML93-0399]|nr:ATP-binding protein [Xanthomonadaceae bacterium NML93-0399]